MKSLIEILEMKRAQWTVYVLLLSAPLLLTIYRYHGYAEHFSQYFPGFKNHPLSELYAHYWQFGQWIFDFMFWAVLPRCRFTKSSCFKYFFRHSNLTRRFIPGFFMAYLWRLCRLYGVLIYIWFLYRLPRFVPVCLKKPIPLNRVLLSGLKYW